MSHASGDRNPPASFVIPKNMNRNEINSIACDKNAFLQEIKFSVVLYLLL